MANQIRIEDQIGGTVLYLKGQFIGGDETDKLRENLKKIADTTGSRVILDLENVTYINSTALGVLISAHAGFIKKNGKLILCNVSKRIENIFVITKLTTVFPIYATVEEALASITN